MSNDNFWAWLRYWSVIWLLVYIAFNVSGCSKAATISPAEYKHAATRQGPSPATATRVEVAPVTTTTTTTITIPESRQ